MSTEQESQGTGYLAGGRDFPENSPVLSYLRSDFFPFCCNAIPGKFRLIMQTPAESPESLDAHSEKPTVVRQLCHSALLCVTLAPRKKS